MAVPYKIMMKKDSSFDDILQRKITRFRFVAKNEKATGKKTVVLDKCLDEKGNRIYILDEPKGNEKKENQHQLKKIRTIKNKWEARRDALVNPLTWHRLISGKIEQKKKVDKENLLYFEMIDEVWGINSHRQRDTIKSVIRTHFSMLYEGTLKEVFDSEVNNKVVGIFENMYTGEILSTRYKNQKPFKHRTLVSYWKHYHRINIQLRKKNYVSDIYSEGNKPAFMNKSIPVKLKGKATQEELKAIYEMDNSTYRYPDIKNCFLWSAMFSGMRYTTMSNLKWKNFEDKKDGTVRIYLKDQTKTDEELIQFHKKDKYWNEFIGKRKDDEDYVFDLPKLENGDVNNSYILASFKWMLQKNNIYREGLSPKLCRHTCAYRMLKATDSDIYRVSKHLGHKSINTTRQNYVREGDEFYKKSSKYLSDIDRFFVPDSV